MDTRAQEIRAEDINPRFNWGRALPALGIMGVDFEERVDYRRLHRYRLGRVKQANDGCRIGDIGTGRHRPPAGCLDLANHGLGRGFAAGVVDDNGETVVR